MNIRKTSICLIAVLSSLLYSSCNFSGDNPQSLLKVANLRIDNYKIKYQSNNLERDASVWDCYHYILELPKPIDIQLINQLEELVKNNSKWEYNELENEYQFQYERDEFFSLSIYVNANDATIIIFYMECDWLF